MPSVRLNQNYRYHIARNLMRPIHDRRSNLIEEIGQARDVAYEVYKEIHPQRIRDILDQMEEIDSGSVFKTDEVRIDVSYTDADTQETKSIQLRLDLGQRMNTLRKYSYTPTLNVSIDEAILDPIRDKITALITVNKRINLINKTYVNDVISKAKSTKQLIEAWPTAVEYFPEELRTRHFEKPVKREPAPPPEKITVSKEGEMALIKEKFTQ